MADEWNFVNHIPILGHVKVAVHKILEQEKEAEETFHQANRALLRAVTGIESGNENSMPSMQNMNMQNTSVHMDQEHSITGTLQEPSRNRTRNTRGTRRAKCIFHELFNP